MIGSLLKRKGYYQIMSNAKNITLSDVLSFIASADRETRRVVNREIIALGNDEDRTARDDFKYGDKVKFSPRKRGYPPVITGTIVKRNIKTIEVRPDNGGRNWKVSASLLSKV